MQVLRNSSVKVKSIVCIYSEAQPIPTRGSTAMVRGSGKRPNRRYDHEPGTHPPPPPPPPKQRQAREIFPVSLFHWWGPTPQAIFLRARRTEISVSAKFYSTVIKIRN